MRCRYIKMSSPYLNNVIIIGSPPKRTGRNNNERKKKAFGFLLDWETRNVSRPALNHSKYNPIVLILVISICFC